MEALHVGWNNPISMEGLYKQGKKKKYCKSDWALEQLAQILYGLFILVETSNLD